MRRFALAIIVGLLTLSASGISTLVVAEPCVGYEQTGQEDADCPPTCLTCGCCAQAVEPVLVSVATSPEAPVVEINPFVLCVPTTRAREILHVPKLRVS
jgi:hypothetical protein